MRAGLGVLGALVLVAALASGCVTYTPPEPLEPARAPPLVLEARELAASDVTLVGYGNAFAMPVVVPEGARAVRLTLEIAHVVGSGFRWSGLGACEGTLGSALGHHVGESIERECGNLPAGEHTLVVSHDAGASSGRVSVTAEVARAPGTA